MTAEINPPDSASAAGYLERVKPLVGLLDAVHISDNSLASPHMCGLAMAALIERMGLETILHMTCRDRNRNILQADLLGAAALGVKNVLCLTGDHPAIGDHRSAKPVFDLDAVSWTDTARIFWRGTCEKFATWGSTKRFIFWSASARWPGPEWRARHEQQYARSGCAGEDHPAS